MSSYTNEGINLATLKGSKTEQNLHTALSGESQAYLRYKWFERKAKNDGYVSISRLFAETAANEMEHAEIWFRYLGGYKDTAKNLETAAGGEHFEWETMYAQFAEEAKAEGFTVIADLFEKVASVEKQHEENYRRMLSELQEDRIFKSTDKETRWICLNCGYVVTGSEPPAYCPTCAHPKGYFEKKQH